MNIRNTPHYLRSILRAGTTSAMAVAFLVAAPISHALLLVERDDMKFSMEVHTVGRLQALDHRANDEAAANFARRNVSERFQHAIGNLAWEFEWADYMDVYFDVTIASRVAADKMWGHQGFMYIKTLPENSPVAALNGFFDHFDVKAGQFITNFGNEVHRRSLNADVQRNPLIGNPIVSPHATEVALELIHNNPEGFGAMIGIGSGVATENFDEGTRFSYRGKVWAPVPGVDMSVAASYYQAKHGPELQRGSNLFRTDRLGGAYGGILDAGSGAGQVMIGNGTNLRAWQLDSTWQAMPDLEIWGHFGRATDGVAATEESWLYYGLTGQYHIVPEKVYLAARYSAANASKFRGDRNNDGDIQRWQIGGGVEVLRGLLFKAEYVHQRSSGFSHGAMSGVQLNQNPGFSGFISEFSLSF